MSKFTLVLNNTNTIGNFNSQFRYNFVGGGFSVPPNSEICVTQAVVPFSWFNCSQPVYSNATFTYTWYYGSGLSRNYTVVFPPGNYSTVDFNYYLEQYFISQNQYFTNASTGQNLYFISLISNQTYYTNQFIFSPIPTSLPTGYSEPPAGFNYNNSTAYGYCVPGFSYTPRINIPSYTGIYGWGSLIGYLGGTYPSTLQTVSYNSLGNTIPNINPVSSVIMTCDLCKNDCTTPNNIIDSFSPANTAFGYNINYSSNFEKYVSLDAGCFSSLTISLLSPTFNQIVANDNNVMIQLTIKLGKFPVISYDKFKVNYVKKLFDGDEEKK